MKVLQQPVSDTQKSAFFYHGVIAEQGDYKLETYQDGEIAFDENNYIGSDTPDLATNDIHDSDIENEDIVDIYVDKFFCIKFDGDFIDEGRYIYDDYDEAIAGFKEFLTKIS